MINLLPPQIKAENGYARYNAILVRYIWLLVVVIVAVGLEFGGTELYLAHQRSHFDHEVATKQQQIAGYKGLRDQAKAANARLKAFKGLVSGQARFSDLLDDLASHTPKGVFINAISLTGDTSKAVKISATANSYQSAVSLRDALVTSSRIQNAAIDDIANPAPNVYNVDITIAFKAGAAK